jgi:hypothetical protein
MSVLAVNQVAAASSRHRASRSTVLFVDRPHDEPAGRVDGAVQARNYVGEIVASWQRPQHWRGVQSTLWLHAME